MVAIGVTAKEKEDVGGGWREDVGGGQREDVDVGYREDVSGGQRDNADEDGGTGERKDA